MDTYIPFESAIPDHLVADRSRPTRMPKSHAPPAKLYCARFDPAVTGVVIQYVGLQFVADSVDAQLLRSRITYWKGCFRLPYGPAHVDEANCIDAAGYTNVVFATYWKSWEAYDTWLRALPVDWYRSDIPEDGPLGTYLIVLKPSVWDFETSFSHRNPEGLGHLCDGWSGPTLEHSYWGSMRDRIPRSQIDAMDSSLGPLNMPCRDPTTFGRIVHITPHDNLVVIRSGQDWSDVGEAERAYYQTELMPKLEKGMAEITNGLEWGCFCQNLLTLQSDGAPQMKTYSLSMWRSLQDLEDWTTKSSRHMEIFASRIEHERMVQGRSMLRTYHEVFVVRAEAQAIEYFNCHPSTGLLNIK